MSGDDVGAFFTFDTQAGEQIEVQIGVSFVSIANARENLDKEQSGFNFEKVKADARKQWNEELSKIEVEGGTYDDKVVFYTALYHILIHPNILQDVNGQYPVMESDRIETAKAIVIRCFRYGILIGMSTSFFLLYILRNKWQWSIR